MEFAAAILIAKGHGTGVLKLHHCIFAYNGWNDQMKQAIDWEKAIASSRHIWKHDYCIRILTHGVMVPAAETRGTYTTKTSIWGCGRSACSNIQALVFGAYKEISADYLLQIADDFRYVRHHDEIGSTDPTDSRKKKKRFLITSPSSTFL